MEERYQAHAIEEKWQRIWAQNQAFRVNEDAAKPKYYVLEMFPYPSGRIHMGHVRNYSIGDVVARYKRMRGFNVLHPMGWDAFGLPAENAAIERGVHPEIWTQENILYMKNQLQRMGLSYDWDREIATCEPEYYRWNQWIFLQFFKKTLAYKRSSFVNWCPSCETVLANEQVIDGACWRCDSAVIQKELEQWFFRITDYAEQLLGDLEKLNGWPDKVLTMQRNWIGKSIGAEIDFPLVGCESALRIFTTRPDTIFGATFVSLAVEHPLALKLAQGTPQEKAVEAFIERFKNVSQAKRGAEEGEKEGVFTGAYCRNLFTGENIPIYLANFVLMEYGTGAVMAVPAHDQRDFEFARKYDLPIRVVIQPNDRKLTAETIAEAYVDDGVMVDSGAFSGTPNCPGKDKIATHAEEKGWGKKAIRYRLRDWGVSRQRYWGTPIPIIYCDKCGTVPVPEEQLPVLLPYVQAFRPTGTDKSPLASVESFVQVTCPVCGGEAQRETDVSDTFLDSSWYYLRYPSSKFNDRPWDPERTERMLPVDIYFGGKEHIMRHHLYARFVTMALHDLGHLPFTEPFPHLRLHGLLIKDGFKMSKSRGNVVNPDEYVALHGADNLRMYLLFCGPWEDGGDFSDKGMVGMERFISRAWSLVTGIH